MAFEGFFDVGYQLIAVNVSFSLYKRRNCRAYDRTLRKSLPSCI